MYSEAAKARRKCTGTRLGGGPCRAWACWDDPQQRCVAHAGRHHTGPMLPEYRYRDRPAHVPACTCEAYAWPHRPGSGVCRWPDPPAVRCLTPQGTRRNFLRRRNGRYVLRSVELLMNW